MSDNQLDNLFEKGLRNSEFPYREGAWENAEKLIIESEKGSGASWSRYLILGLILLISGTLGVVYLLGPSTTDQSLVEEDKPQLVMASANPDLRAEPQNPATQKPVYENPVPSSDPVLKPQDSQTPPSSIARKASIPPQITLAAPSQEDQYLDDGASSGSYELLGKAEPIDPLLAGPFDNSSQNDISEKRRVPSNSKTGLRIDLLGGLIPSLETGLETDGEGLFPFYAGANLVVLPSNRIEIGLGVQYEQLRVNGQSREIRQSEFSFGSTETVYNIENTGYGFVSIPVYMAYKPGPRHRIKAGIQYSRLIKVQSTESISTYHNGQITGQTSSIQEGYFGDLNENSVSALLGYEYKLKSRLGLDIQGRLGLTPLESNSSSNQQMFHLKVGLTYYLWGK